MGWDCIGFRTDDLLGLRLTVGIGEGDKHGYCRINSASNRANRGEVP